MPASLDCLGAVAWNSFFDDDASPKDFSYRWLSLLAMPAMLGLVSALLMQPASPVDQTSTERDLYQDFRGAQGLRPPLRMVGPNADEVTKFENEGLRITLPGNRPAGGRDVVGIRGDLDLVGDFAITGTYELISTVPAPTGAGMGAALQIATDNAFTKFARVACFIHPKMGRVFQIESWDKNAPDGKRDHRWRDFPTAARTGRLRLSREATTLRFLASEGLDGEFREVYQQEFGSENVAIVRFIVNNHNSPTPVDARLVDLRVHCASLDISSSRGEEPMSRAWTVVAIVIGMVIVLSVSIICFAWYWWGKRSIDQATGQR